MFDRFTPRARQVIVLAQDDARELTYDYIGTEHLLLGLLREEEGLVARTLSELGVLAEASGYAPAAAETDEVRPSTDGPYIVGDE